MELKVREYVLIEKLRAMIKREKNPELIAEYMHEIAKLERQRRKIFFKENSSMSLERDRS